PPIRKVVYGASRAFSSSRERSSPCLLRLSEGMGGKLVGTGDARHGPARLAALRWGMNDGPERVFLLSPAHCGGRRAQLLLNEAAEFPLAQRIRSPEGAPLGEVFSFLSGLYFRGKLTYARRFG